MADEHVYHPILLDYGMVSVEWMDHVRVSEIRLCDLVIVLLLENATNIFVISLRSYE